MVEHGAGAEAIARYWNWRDCDQTELSDDVHDALFVFDLLEAPDIPGPAHADDVISKLTALPNGVEATRSGAADGRTAPELRLG